MASRPSSTPLLRVLRAGGGGGARSTTGLPSKLSTSSYTTTTTTTTTLDSETPAFLPLRKRDSLDSKPYQPSSLYPLPYLPYTSPTKIRLSKPAISRFLKDLPPTPQSLSVILSRLTLKDNDKTAQLLVQAITHPSHSSDPTQNNLLLSEVGRSIIGFVTSEYYSKKYPNLPTKALKLLMTALTNREAMEFVGSEVGITLNSEMQGRWNKGVVGGVQVKYKRWLETREVELTNQKRHTKMTAEENRVKGRKGGAVYMQEKRVLTSTHEADAIVSAVRALVGLIYQEKGLPAAAAFINGHFISRQVDLPSLLRFEKPFEVLKNSVLRYGLTLPVGRLLKESGRHTASPYYVVGYFSDDIKLGEGFGKSYEMASHRAATNSLQSLYLATSPHPVLSIATLPPFPLSSPPLLPTEAKYRSLAPPIGESESMHFSSGRAPQGWVDEGAKDVGEPVRGVETFETGTTRAFGGVGEQERLMRAERS